MLNLHEDTKCSVFETCLIVIAAITAAIVFAFVLDSALEKTEDIARARLDAQLSPAQRAEIMRGHQ